MEEQIYQTVWCQVFVKSWTQEGEGDVTPEDCTAFASNAADLAAAGAVRKWDESKRHSAIIAKDYP